MLRSGKRCLIVILFELYLLQNSFYFCDGNWILKWSDHFTNNSFDKNSWKLHDFTDGYTCHDNKPQVKDNKLILTVEKISSDLCKIRATGIKTKLGWTYGKWEINASVEYNSAVAYIAMFPVNNIYSSLYKFSGGYIDIFRHDNEHLKVQTKLSGIGIRFGNYSEDQTTLDKQYESRLDSGYHTYAFEWNKTDMIWKIDYQMVFKVFIYKYLKLSGSENYRKKGEPFDQPFYLLLTNQFYSFTDHSNIHVEFKKSSFLIDYVKYYEWKDSEANLLQTNTSRIISPKPESCSHLYYTIGLLCILNVLVIISLLIYRKQEIFKTLFKKNVDIDYDHNRLNSVYSNDTQVVELLESN